MPAPQLDKFHNKTRNQLNLNMFPRADKNLSSSINRTKPFHEKHKPLIETCVQQEIS